MNNSMKSSAMDITLEMIQSFLLDCGFMVSMHGSEILNVILFEKQRM